MNRNRKNKLTYTQIIVLGFAVIILLGATLLCFPVSSSKGEWTPFVNSIFTAVSSTCVTGLSVYNTAEYWSFFGQIVILCLIQIGGLGFISLISIISVISKRQIGLHGRRLIMESAGSTRMSGVVDMLKRLVLGTFIFEILGAIALAIRFSFEMPVGKAIYWGIFHSVSAFCNAGFDITGDSFAPYAGDIWVNITLILLIVIGGLGFFVWSDIWHKKLNFKKYELQTKIVLLATAILIVGGWLLFFIVEKNYSMEGMALGERIIASLFQSVTPRTAGFYALNQAALSESGSVGTIILMFIGGSPGSTAGGVKTTTVIIMLASIFANARNIKNVHLFKKKIDEDNITHAAAVCGIYLVNILAAVIFVCAIEPFSLKEILYEIVSAIGTTGLSMGITASLTVVSKIILILLMFTGRIGGLTIALVFAKKRDKDTLERPTEKILIG